MTATIIGVEILIPIQLGEYGFYIFEVKTVREVQLITAMPFI